MKRIFILILFLSITVCAQQKENNQPDSTQFKYWYNEISKTQTQIRSLDSVKIKLIGIFEYQYGKLIEEKRKIDVVKEKK